jgi:hypothetical protein
MSWLERGREEGAEFVIIVCDTFDYEDYPVYCNAVDYHLKYASHSTNMQRVMEVYDLSLPLQEQLDEKRAFHPPKG